MLLTRKQTKKKASLTDTAKMRLRGKKNTKKGMRTFKVILVLLMLGGLGTGIYLFVTSELFALSDVKIHGNRHLSDAELRSLAGIEEGENLFALSSKEKAMRLMASPWIKDVSIRKEFPRQLLVKVNEAVPQALLKSGGKIYLVDSAGDTLEEMSGRREFFLPVIVGKVEKENRAYHEAVSLAGIVCEQELMRKAKTIEIAGFDRGVENLSIRIDGLLVLVGEGRYEEKLAMLQELSDEIQSRMSDIEYYVDMRFADRVVVKPVSAREHLVSTGGGA